MSNDEPVNCYSDEGTVRCEIDEREVEMVTGHIEAFREEIGEPADPETCAAYNESVIELGREVDFREGPHQAIAMEMVAKGCPFPKIEPNEDGE